MQYWQSRKDKQNLLQNCELIYQQYDLPSVSTLHSTFSNILYFIFHCNKLTLYSSIKMTKHPKSTVYTSRLSQNQLVETNWSYRKLITALSQDLYLLKHGLLSFVFEKRESMHCFLIFTIHQIHLGKGSLRDIERCTKAKSFSMVATCISRHAVNDDS